MSNKLLKNFILMFSFVFVFGMVFCLNSTKSEAYYAGICNHGWYSRCSGGSGCSSCGCPAHPFNSGSDYCWFHWNNDDISCCTGHAVSSASKNYADYCSQGWIGVQWHCSICNRDFSILENTNRRNKSVHTKFLDDSVEYFWLDNNDGGAKDGNGNIFNDTRGTCHIGCSRCGENTTGHGAIWIVEVGKPFAHDYGTLANLYWNQYGYLYTRCQHDGNKAFWILKDCNHIVYRGTHTIFDVNGGNAVGNYYNLPYNGIQTLPTPTRAGYTFMGWKVTGGNSNRIGQILGAGNYYNIDNNQGNGGLCNEATNGTVYLQAQWLKNVNIEYFANAGNVPYGSKGIYDYWLTDSIAPTQVFTPRPAPTRSGYEFAGWQTWEVRGATPYSNIICSTNTNELTRGQACIVSPYGQNFPNQWANFGAWNTNDDRTIVLVAIWRHKHPTVSGQGLNLGITDGYLIGNSVDPLSYTDGLNLPTYYVKGSNTNRITASYNMGSLVNGGGYSSLSGKLQYRTQNGGWTDFPASGLSGSWIASQPNHTVYIRGQSTFTCRWCDLYTSCNATSVLGERVYRVIADSTSPTEGGDENYLKMQTLTALERSTVPSYRIIPYLKDDTIYDSGLRSCNISVYNKDNGMFTSYGNYSFEYGWGHTIKATSADVIDIATLNKQFSGDYTITLTATDMVGNTMTRSIDMATFDMDVTLTSQTFNPTNYKDGIVLFKQGEAGNLTVKTYGYANALAVEFPSDWYVSEKNPLYLYWGDVNNYDASKLQKITQNVFYIKNDNPVDTWVQNFIFVTPTGIEENVKTIKVTAYKGDVNVIENKSINVNQGTTTSLTKLCRNVQLRISGDIYDQIKTIINNTYRARGTK